MKRAFIVAGALIVAWVGGGLAQSVPDFSGTWVWNKAKSDPPPAMPGPAREPAAPFGPAGLFTSEQPSGPVLITQTATKLTFEGKGGKVIYRLDGRESRNHGPHGTMVSTSHWEGVSLITEMRETFSTPRGEITVEDKEVRTLSQDGQTMTVEGTRMTPRGAITRKLVVEKKNH